jgi:hypothetical protein
LCSGSLYKSTNVTLVWSHNFTGSYRARGSLRVKLNSSFRKFYSHHHDLINKWPHICSICHNYNLVLSSFLIYHQVCNKSNMTGATCRAVAAYPSRAPEFTPIFSGVCVAWSLVFCVMLCMLLFVLFSSPCQRQCELLPSLVVRHLSSVNFSHFNLLLWKPSTKWTETW